MISKVFCKLVNCVILWKKHEASDVLAGKLGRFSTDVVSATNTLGLCFLCLIYIVLCLLEAVVHTLHLFLPHP